VKVTFVDGTDLDQWKKAVIPAPRRCSSNRCRTPTLELVDIEGVARIAHAAGALVIVDNVFATPIFSRAVEQGADVVVYSTTKHIDGAGPRLGGVICGTRRSSSARGAEPYMKHTGGAMSPFNAWLHAERHGDAGPALPGHGGQRRCRSPRLWKRARQLSKVIYPGLASHPQHALAMAQMGSGGTLVAFEVKGGKEAAFRFMNALELIARFPTTWAMPSRSPPIRPPPPTSACRRTRRRPGHHAGPDPAVGGAGRCGRPDRRPGAGAGAGLRTRARELGPEARPRGFAPSRRESRRRCRNPRLCGGRE
jgi:O-acetylhomoserine/O-acetylserine sulfhydrylase-like pyridoxal-dependent enzyme